jgi:hypothetical protein
MPELQIKQQKIGNFRTSNQQLSFKAKVDSLHWPVTPKMNITCEKTLLIMQLRLK